MPKPAPKIKPVEVAPEKPMPSPKKTEIPDVEILDFATEEPRSLYQTRITMPEIPVLAPNQQLLLDPNHTREKFPSYFLMKYLELFKIHQLLRFLLNRNLLKSLKVAPKVSDKKREELKELGDRVKLIISRKTML